MAVATAVRAVIMAAAAAAATAVVAVVAAVVVNAINFESNGRGGVYSGRRPTPFSEGKVLSLFHSFMEEHIEIEGRILTVLAGTMFRVELDNKHQVLATISGKMRKKFVRLTSGDRVKMEMSPYDLNKARIVWRIG